MEKAVKCKRTEFEFSWIDPRNNASNKNLKYAINACSILANGQSVKFLKNRPQNISKTILQAELKEQTRVFETGGTSGKPSTVFHNDDSITSAIRNLQEKLGSEPISSLCCLPLNHVGGWMQIERAKYTKGTVLFADYKEIICSDLTSVLTNSWISLVPTQLHYLLGFEQAMKNLRASNGVFTGGAKLTEEIQVQLRKYDIPIFPCYGMSETAGMITLLDSNQFLDGVDGVGHALPSVKMKLVENQVFIRTGSLCYQKNETTTQEEWYKTNDLATYDSNFGYTITGRIDRLINTGGIKVNPESIENVILEHPDVSQCLVLGQKDEHWVEKIVAYLVLSNGDLSLVQKQLKASLQDYETPKEWHCVQDLPLTDMGKIRKPN
jgi:O-succinylbenzoic acid--CoA ligase